MTYDHIILCIFMQVINVKIPCHNFCHIQFLYYKFYINVWVVIKSPPWVIHLTGWVFLLRNFVVCFTITIKELTLESYRILSE